MTRIFPGAALLLAVLLPLLAVAQDCPPGLSTGQLVYVPSYSHTAVGAAGRVFDLSVTLSVHNIDPLRPIVISAVDYYSTTGGLLKKYLAESIRLGPLETREFVIREKDNPGGSGDNFLIRWHSRKPANPPLVETLMIGTSMGQGISMTSRGVVVVE